MANILPTPIYPLTSWPLLFRLLPHPPHEQHAPMEYQEPLLCHPPGELPRRGHGTSREPIATSILSSSNVQPSCSLYQVDIWQNVAGFQRIILRTLCRHRRSRLVDPAVRMREPYNAVCCLSCLSFFPDVLSGFELWSQLF